MHPSSHLVTSSIVSVILLCLASNFIQSSVVESNQHQNAALLARIAAIRGNSHQALLKSLEQRRVANSSISFTDTKGHRVVGGAAVPEGRAPHQVKIYLTDDVIGAFISSGSLIGPKTVLTEAYVIK